MTTSVLANIADDLLICGKEQVVDKAVKKFQISFTLSLIAHIPGLLRFLGLKLTQHEDNPVSIDCDDKLRSIATAPMTRVRQRDTTDPLSQAKLKTFATINSYIGWLDIRSILFCALLSSSFHWSASTATVVMLCNQSVGLAKLQKLRTLSYFSQLDDSASHSPVVINFCDVGCPTESRQLCHICGLLIAVLVRTSSFHVISWSSHIPNVPFDPPLLFKHLQPAKEYMLKK